MSHLEDNIPYMVTIIVNNDRSEYRSVILKHCGILLSYCFASDTSPLFDMVNEQEAALQSPNTSLRRNVERPGVDTESTIFKDELVCCIQMMLITVNRRRHHNIDCHAWFPVNPNIEDWMKVLKSPIEQAERTNC